MTFIATAKNGNLDFGSEYNKARLRQELKDNERKSYRLELIKPLRSVQQNRLLWLYYGIISRETGHTAEEIHQWAKRMFLPPKFITVMGKEMKVPSSTTELTKSDMAEYMLRIQVETGVPIPSWEELEKQGYLKN